MASLQVLRLENNRIDALPDNIGSCKALVKLDLSTNNLLSLPDSMGQFRKLQRLNVANNMLRRVPASMGGLKTLKELDLRYACLSCHHCVHIVLSPWEDQMINVATSKWCSVHMCLSAIIALHWYHIKAAEVSMSSYKPECQQINPNLQLQRCKCPWNSLISMPQAVTFLPTINESAMHTVLAWHFEQRLTCCFCSTQLALHSHFTLAACQVCDLACNSRTQCEPVAFMWHHTYVPQLTLSGS